MKVNLLHRVIDDRGDGGSVFMGNLGRAIQPNHIIGGIAGGDGPAGFQRYAGVAADFQPEPDDVIRPLESVVDITVFLYHHPGFRGHPGLELADRA